MSKNPTHSGQLGHQIDHQSRVWSGLFGGGAAESYDRCFWGSDVVLTLVGLSCLDQIGSSCNAGLIAVFWER
jgi:hypothetical protein